MRRSGILMAFERLKVGRGLAVVALLVLLVPYVYLRGIADDFGIPRQTVVVSLEAWVGGGLLPSEWLQEHIYAPGTIRPFDRFWLLVYGLWFPSAVLGATWFAVRRWDHFGRLTLAWLALFYVALVPFFLLPTEPPWMLDGIDRIVIVAEGSVVQIDTNQVAAMPSLHVGMPAMFALRARASGMSLMWRIWGAFSVLTAFAVVYLGEHFVIDTVAGVGLAWVAVRLTSLQRRGAAVAGRAEEASSAEPLAFPRPQRKAS